MSSDRKTESTTQPLDINYQEEMICLFFNNILSHVLEEYEEYDATQDNYYSEEIGEDEYQSGDEYIMKFFKTIQAQDFDSASVISAIGNNIVLKKTASDENKRPLEQVREDYLKSMSTISSITKQRCKKMSHLSSQTSNSLEDNGWMIMPNKCTAYLRFSNGNRYEGEVNRKLIEGEGRFIWANGTIYEGNFKNGMPDGKGLMVLHDLSTYQGDFGFGMFHGMGVFSVIQSSMLYCGLWKWGKKHGKGWMFYGPDNWYDGEWEEDKPSGFGFRNYSKDCRYKGSFSKGERGGKGIFIWPNKDVYKGEWKDGKIDGFGEYVWNSVQSFSFCYALNSWYKGSWQNGYRHGAGVLHFGFESGARLAGVWQHNFKHGPGILVCGNGITIESNPLFELDKFVYTRTFKSNYEEEVKEVKSASDTDDFDKSSRANTEKMVHQINKKVISTRKSRTSTRIINIASRRSLFPTYLIDIPIHAVASDVKLDFYISQIAAIYSECVKARNAKCVEQPVNYDNFKTFMKCYSDFYGRSKESEKGYVQYLNIQDEEVNLRFLITGNLLKLKGIYFKYATLAVFDQPVTYEPIMLRLFLWQMFRDIGIIDYGISLIDIDKILADNPESCVESDHDPFEPIYFWQFLQVIVGCAVLFYQEHGELEELPSSEVSGFIVRKFFNEMLYPGVLKSRGCYIASYMDVLPIESCYDLYLKVGDLHTARTFLQETTVKKSFEPPCYLTILTENEEEENTFINGYNCIPFSKYFQYFPRLESIDNLDDTLRKPLHEDPFFKSLYVFRHLGVRKIGRILVETCPPIMKEGLIVNMNYQLTFLEFMEVLLQCSVKLINKLGRMKERQKFEPRVSEASVQDKTKKSNAKALKVKVKK